MTEHRFDELAKLVGARTSRRAVLKATLALAAASLLTRFKPDSASATRTPAIAPATDAFQRTWARTDQPVANGDVSRTWMWGPEAFTEASQEPYAEAPGGQRTVQYFDKARMEDNSWRDPSPPWDVTNGLLVVELVGGRLQLGDATFEERQPAQVNVAGDADDPDGPTYATFAAVLDAAPLATGATITQRISRDGTTSDDPALAGHGITVAIVDEVTNHGIAAPFWAFMTSSGPVYEDGQLIEARLFQNDYFATGRPISEAYWADVLVGGTLRLVLMQCFERRCLTYTLGNPAGWQVEAGNVGLHYDAWRNAATGQVTFGYAPEDVEAGLIAATQANADYQALAAYLTGLGFYETGIEVYQAAEAGGATSYTLVTSYQEDATPAGLARITYASADDVTAIVQNADATLFFAVYVGADGELVAAYPESDPADIAALRGGIGPNSPGCTSCISVCEAQINQLDVDLEDACLVFAAYSCAELLNLDGNKLRVCVIGSWAGCLLSGGATVCGPICRYACVADCETNPDCGSTKYCCGGRCVDLTTSLNCGTCGTYCGLWSECDGTKCIDVKSDEANCGKVGKQCEPGHVCINGSCKRICEPACPVGQKCCDGVCTDVSSNVANCGYCGRNCDAIGDEDSDYYYICQAGQCVQEEGACNPPCESPLTCCDERCVDLNASRDHCGGCGNDCFDRCCSGVCTDTSTSRLDCGACDNACLDGETCCNGQCADLDTDTSHCGTCGTSCDGGEYCSNGTCCPPGESNCSGFCYDLHTDPFNCGGCGIECPGGWECCNGECAELDSDPDHCGVCGNDCGNLTCCDGQCKNIESDPANCGFCGNDCPSGQCVNGSCVSQAECGPGLPNCPTCKECVNGTCVSCSYYCCENGTCIPDGACCPGEHIDCGGGLCCDAVNFPVCCNSTPTCCPGAYPICPPPGRNWCCASGEYLCANDDWCCPHDCTCLGGGQCDCPASADEQITPFILAGGSAGGGAYGLSR